MRSLGDSPSKQELELKLPEIKKAIILDGLEVDENGMVGITQLLCDLNISLT